MQFISSALTLHAHEDAVDDARTIQNSSHLSEIISDPGQGVSDSVCKSGQADC